MKLLQMNHVQKSFNDETLHVLKDISLSVEKGEVVAIIGPSGSGKSTLLRCATLLTEMDAGELIYGDIQAVHNDADGKAVYADKGELKKVREKFGLVFQSFNLFPHYSVLKNLMDPQIRVLSRDKGEAQQRARKLLEKMGLSDKENAYPCELSGGQQQRVAIARALATNPKVLLCDEATSALDPKTTRQILELIGDINKKLGITVVIITHQMSVVKEVCNHVAILDDGEVVEEGLVSTVFSAPKSAAARHLVFPRGADIDVSDPQQQRRIRLIFRSAKTTSIPLVARLATEENIAANVISASTQKLSEEIYGSMLLGVPAAQFDRAWEFLSGIENLQVVAEVEFVELVRDMSRTESLLDKSLNCCIDPRVLHHDHCQ